MDPKEELKRFNSGDLQDELDRREEEESIHAQTHVWLKYIEKLSDEKFLHILYSKSDGISGGDYKLNIKPISLNIIKDLNELHLCGIMCQISKWNNDDGSHMKTVEYTNSNSIIIIDTCNLESINTITEDEFIAEMDKSRKIADSWN